MESDLVGLRAELHKKRLEASKYGVGQKGLPRKPTQKLSKTTSFNIHNAGVAARDAYDKAQKEEETITAEKARSILEKKALLYEKLHGGTDTLEDDDLNEKYLVNFQRKIVDEVTERKKLREEEEDLKAEQSKREESDPEMYKAKKKDEEWIEYTDVLGRTRECMRKDLPTMVDQDKNLLGEDQDEGEKEAELISGEMYREKLREKWEHEEEINAFKKDLHYQDVIYDEARTHGAGYMKFSKDEKERKEQMKMLKEMHEEAARAEQMKKVATNKKQKLLQARLEKVRQRKRLKLGLPIKDNSELKTPPESDEEELIGPPMPPTLIETKPENANVESVPKVKPQIREWDVGKGAGGPGPLSQEAWVDRQRKQRQQEFAPPSIYDSNKRFAAHPNPSTSHREFSSQGTSCSNFEEPRKETKNAQFAPPSTYEYYGPSSFSGRGVRGKPNYKAMENAIDKGLSNLRKMSHQ